MPDFVKVAKMSDITNGSGKCVEVEDKRIALFHAEGEFFAIDDTCTHAGGHLSEGFLEGDVVKCPWHGAHFNIKSGEVTSPPASDGVAAYKVRVTGKDVEVEV